MTITLVKLSYHSKKVPDPGLVLQTPLCSGGAETALARKEVELKGFVILLGMLR